MTISSSFTKIDYLTFHNTKDTLSEGVYQVNESDGDFSYAVLNGNGAIKWLTEYEYARELGDRARIQMLDDQLNELMDQGDDDAWDQMLIDQEANRLADEIHAGEPEYITDVEYNQYVTDCWKTIEENLPPIPVDPAEKALSEPLTLGDMLRRHMNS